MVSMACRWPLTSLQLPATHMPIAPLTTNSGLCAVALAKQRARLGQESRE